MKLDPNFATTRFVTRKSPPIDNAPSSKIQQRLFLSSDPTRKGEGGLRMKGYFKKSLAGDSMTSPLPLITIVTVVFNNESYIERTIRSVLQQTYENVEYIIIDGGSSDRTLDIIREYEDKIDYWVSEPDRGLYDAMNKGLQLASGDIIGLLNSDDIYTPRALQIVRDLYIQEVKPGRSPVITGAIYSIDEKRGVRIKVETPPNFLDRIEYNTPLHHPATFVARSVYQKLGGFDINYKISSDYDFIFRCYRSPEVYFVVTANELTEMTKGGLSMKFNSLIINLKNNFSIRKNHEIPLYKNIIYSLQWFLKEGGKHIFKILLSDRATVLYYRLRHGKNSERVLESDQS
jgi:glycosyltransferase involved in cell wall biosynthesis